jgi:hypothetical protein
MTRLYYKTTVTIIVILVMFILLCQYVLNNVQFLIMITAGTNRPSVVHYWERERIYKLSEEHNISSIILYAFKSGKDEYHLKGIYIILLGQLGDKNASGYLIKDFVDCNGKSNCRSSEYYIRDSLGQIGNEMAVPFLERILETYDDYDPRIPKWSVARALYLITGKSYEYGSPTNKRAHLVMTDELMTARQIILSSKDRKRTFDEMITLDKLTRPTKW